MHAPTITVIVPSYNYAHYLHGTLTAVLDQSCSDFECLVIDDGSTDESIPLAHSFAARDSRVRVLTHPDGKNHGLHASLGLALSQAKGQWTAFLEADDLWHPQCLETRLAVAQKSGAGVVCNDIAPMIMPGAEVDWFEGYVPRVMRWHAQRHWTNAVPIARPANVAPFLLENKIPTFSCAMVNTELLRSVSLQTPVARWLDWWVWAQLAAKTSFAFCPEKLTHWRLHPESWHHKVEMHSYIGDFQSMGGGFRHLFTKDLARQKRLGVLTFLWLPASLRLIARLALTAREDSMTSLVRRIASRLDFTKKNRRF